MQGPFCYPWCREGKIHRHSYATSLTLLLRQEKAHEAASQQWILERWLNVEKTNYMGLSRAYIDAMDSIYARNFCFIFQPRGTHYRKYRPKFQMIPICGQNCPGLRFHGISIHGFTKIHGYQHGYPWFLDVSLQLSIQVWISTEISKQGYPCKDILQWISVNNKYPRMDIHVYMDISLQLSMLLWISIWISLDFYGYPCIDLL